MDPEIKELRELFKETDRLFKESARRQEESALETDQLFKETARRQEESSRRQEETDRFLKEMHRETDREIRRVSKLVGDIGNNFGRFTEGMAEPSMRKLLKKFGMTAIQPRALFHSKDGSRSLEVDVLGYDANDLSNEVYIIEVKSRLTTDSVSQALKTIADFRELGPVGLRHRPIYGVIAAVEIPKDMDKTVINHGLYLARINDDTFQLLTPRNFKPKLFLPEKPDERSNGRANGSPRKKKSRKK